MQVKNFVDTLTNLTEKNIEEMAEQQQSHATAFTKQEQDFIAQLTEMTDMHKLELTTQQNQHALLSKDQDERFIVQLKELHMKIDTQERTHLVRLEKLTSEHLLREQELIA